MSTARLNRLKRLRTIIDTHMGTTVRITPMIHSDYGGSTVDATRPAFECVGVLGVGRGETRPGITGYSVSVPAGKARLLVRPESLPTGMVLEKGDQVEALEYDAVPSFEVLKQERNQLGRLVFVLGENT